MNINQIKIFKNKNFLIITSIFILCIFTLIISENFSKSSAHQTDSILKYQNSLFVNFDEITKKEVLSSELKPYKPITIAFAGDIHAEGSASKILNEGLGEIEKVFKESDLTIANLETAIVTSENPIAESKKYLFKTSPMILKSLSKSGIDVLSMANNHGYDYGEIGLNDTLKAKEKYKTPTIIGIGKDAKEAWNPYKTEINGWNIGVLPANDVHEPQLGDSWIATENSGGLAFCMGKDGTKDLLTRTKKLSEEVDLTVVFIHWGLQGKSAITKRQKELSEDLIKNGADIVVGTHAHLLQPMKKIDGSVISYGLGNFAWYHSNYPSNITGVLKIEIDLNKKQKVMWQPAKIINGIPLINGKEGDYPKIN